MVKVGTYEAKTRLSELLDMVAAGEVVAITRHGEEVAHLVPAVKAKAPVQEGFSEKLERWKRTRKNVKLGGVSVRELKNEGRR